MIRARGHLSRTLRNRRYPHQVLVPTENLRAKVLDEVSTFHTELGIPIERSSVRKDDLSCSLYCFADLRHAATFQIVFGGELVSQRSPKKEAHILPPRLRL